MLLIIEKYYSMVNTTNENGYRAYDISGIQMTKSGLKGSKDRCCREPLHLEKKGDLGILGSFGSEVGKMILNRWKTE